MGQQQSPVKTQAYQHGVELQTASELCMEQAVDFSRGFSQEWQSSVDVLMSGLSIGIAQCSVWDFVHLAWTALYPKCITSQRVSVCTCGSLQYCWDRPADAVALLLGAADMAFRVML